jgi:pantothenate synthetase
VDYVAVVDPDTFAEVDPRPGALVIGAARFGSTRLIDTIRIEGR